LEGLAIEDVGLFYGHWVYFVPIWYSLWQFEIYFPCFGVYCTKKNLATLIEIRDDGLLTAGPEWATK
jgi:hypothetical protein